MGANLSWEREGISNKKILFRKFRELKLEMMKINLFLSHFYSILDSNPNHILNFQSEQIMNHMLIILKNVIFMIKLGDGMRWVPLLHVFLYFF